VGSYFDDRYVCMMGVREIVWKSVQRGCPQGSICGLFVWNLMMDELLWQLRRHECKVVAYADDLLLVVEGRSRVELEEKGTKWMNIVCEWSEKVGVSVSESKTVMKGSLMGARYPSICVYGKRIKYSKCVKYLGVWISERMNFKLHLESLIKKITNVIGKLRRVLKAEWGLQKKALRVIYKSLFIASVMHGASVWYSSMQYEYARKLINRCQRVAMCACLNVCRTVSTDVMQVLMGGLPWDLEYIKRGMKFKIKNSISMSDYDVVSEQEIYGKSVCECMKLVNERLYQLWQKRWDECANGRVTYGFNKKVNYVERHKDFNLNLYAGYILTGHGSMNGFLYKRELFDTERCTCGAECEDWKHVLAECPLYDDMRNMEEWGISARDDGSIDVSHVMESKDKYESMCMFGVCAFKRRMSRITTM